MAKHVNESKTKKKSNVAPILSVMLAIGIIIASAFGGVSYTVAKYALSLEDDYHDIVAKGMYFASDFLKPGGANYTIYNYKSGNYQEINLLNYTDDNSISPDTITYTVATTKGTIQNSSGTTISGAQTLTGGSKNNTVLRVVPGSSGAVTVTATASAPYSVTLSATFNFVADPTPTVTASMTNYTGYCVVDVYTPVTSAGTISVKIAWDENTLTPDSTNGKFPTTNTDSGNYRQVTMTLDTGSSYQFIFFKATAGTSAAMATSLAGAGTDYRVYVGS